VTVYPGLYFERVTIPAGKDGLVLKGTTLANRSQTILDPDAPNSGTGLLIQSNDVRVKLLKIRGGDGDAVFIEGEGVLISDMEIVSPESDGVGIAATGLRTRLLRNLIRGVGEEGVNSAANEVVLQANIIGPCDNGCVSLSGDDVLAVNNQIRQSEDGDCLAVTGARANVRGNTLQYCDGEGISVFGENPSVVSNRISGAGGIEIDCTSCTDGLVQFNTVDGVADDEGGLDIYADAAGLVVANNTVLHMADEGATISGIGVVYRQNTTRDNGGDNYEPGVSVYGSGHSILNNKSIGNTEHGFYVDLASDGCTITGNLASDNMGDGFEINGTNNVATSNRAFDNAGEGFQLGGGTNTLTGNTAQRNRVDYCETGPGNTVSGNTFPTTGPCQIDN
jgi:parallel beta-helix repeat protein